MFLASEALDKCALIAQAMQKMTQKSCKKQFCIITTTSLTNTKSLSEECQGYLCSVILQKICKIFTYCMSYDATVSHKQVNLLVHKNGRAVTHQVRPYI